jgi:hypothetical protein
MKIVYPFTSYIHTYNKFIERNPKWIYIPHTWYRSAPSTDRAAFNDEKNTCFTISNGGLCHISNPPWIHMWIQLQVMKQNLGVHMLHWQNTLMLMTITFMWKCRNMSSANHDSSRKGPAGEVPSSFNPCFNCQYMTSMNWHKYNQKDENKN